MTQVTSSISFPDLPDDVLPIIISYCDSTALFRTCTLCKRWQAFLSRLEEEWQKRSVQEFPFLPKKDSHPWRLHYLLNSFGCKLRKIEQFAGRYFGAYGNIIISFPEIQHNMHTIALHSVKTEHESAITTFTPNNKLSSFRLLTGSTDKTVCVWSSHNRQDFAKLCICRGHKSFVTALRWAGSNFLSGGLDGSLYYWVDYETQYHLHSFIKKAHKASITCLETAQDSMNRRYAFSGAADGTINVYELCDTKCTYIKCFKTNAESIFSLCAFTDKSEQVYLFIGSTDERIKIWQFKQNEENPIVSSLEQTHQGGTAEITYMHSSSQLITRGKDNVVKVWQQNGGLHLWTCIKVHSLIHIPLSVITNDQQITYLTDYNIVVKQHNDIMSSHFTLQHPATCTPLGQGQGIPLIHTHLSVQ